MQLSADDWSISQMLEQPADASREEKDGNGASCWGTLLLPQQNLHAGFELPGHFKNKFCKLAESTAL